MIEQLCQWFPRVKEFFVFIVEPGFHHPLVVLERINDFRFMLNCMLFHTFEFKIYDLYA